MPSAESASNVSSQCSVVPDETATAVRPKVQRRQSRGSDGRWKSCTSRDKSRTQVHEPLKENTCLRASNQQSTAEASPVDADGGPADAYISGSDDEDEISFIGQCENLRRESYATATVAAAAVMMQVM